MLHACTRIGARCARTDRLKRSGEKNERLRPTESGYLNSIRALEEVKALSKLLCLCFSFCQQI